VKSTSSYSSHLISSDILSTFHYYLRSNCHEAVMLPKVKLLNMWHKIL